MRAPTPLLVLASILLLSSPAAAADFPVVSKADLEACFQAVAPFEPLPDENARRCLLDREGPLEVTPTSAGSSGLFLDAQAIGTTELDCQGNVIRLVGEATDPVKVIRARGNGITRLRIRDCVLEDAMAGSPGTTGITVEGGTVAPWFWIEGNTIESGFADPEDRGIVQLAQIYALEIVGNRIRTGGDHIALIDWGQLITSNRLSGSGLCYRIRDVFITSNTTSAVGNQLLGCGGIELNGGLLFSVNETWSGLAPGGGTWITAKQEGGLAATKSGCAVAGVRCSVGLEARNLTLEAWPTGGDTFAFLSHFDSFRVDGVFGAADPTDGSGSGDRVCGGFLGQGGTFIDAPEAGEPGAIEVNLHLPRDAGGAPCRPFEAGTGADRWFSPTALLFLESASSDAYQPEGSLRGQGVHLRIHEGIVREAGTAERGLAVFAEGDTTGDDACASQGRACQRVDLWPSGPEVLCDAPSADDEVRLAQCR